MCVCVREREREAKRQVSKGLIVGHMGNRQTRYHDGKGTSFAPGDHPRHRGINEGDAIVLELSSGLLSPLWMRGATIYDHLSCTERA